LIPDRGREFFSSPLHLYQLWAHPVSSQMGIRGSFPGVKWLGHEADHSTPSGAEVKNTWSYTFTPLMSSWCGT